MPLPVVLPGAARGSRRAWSMVDAQHVVRRHLPGPVELLRATSRSSPSSISTIYPEFMLPPDQKKAWLADRTGAIVGADIAPSGSAGRSATAFRIQGDDLRTPSGDERLGVQHRRHLRRRGKGIDKTQFFFRYDYLDENRTRFGQGPVGLVHRQDRRRVAGRRRSRASSTRCSRTRPAETKTDDREGLRRGLRQADRRHRRDHDRRSSSAVLFTILLVAANTMAQSVRERTSELARAQDARVHGRRGCWRWCWASRCFIAVLGGGARAARSPG